MPRRRAASDGRASQSAEPPTIAAGAALAE